MLQPNPRDWFKPEKIAGLDRRTQPRTFAGMLRWLCLFRMDAGWYREPHGHHLMPGPGSKYNQCPREWDMTQEEWDRFVAYTRRYKRFRHYLTEVRPQWREVDRIHYMDNSVEVVEEDKDGNRRTRMPVAPGGDICF
jgi:hypothetical protein